MGNLCCLALYDLEIAPSTQVLYRMIEEIYGGLNMELSEFYLMTSSWPKAKRIISEKVNEEITRHQDIRSVEGNFLREGGHHSYFYISGMASAQSMLFVSAPEEIDAIETLQAFVARLSSKCKLNYGYTFIWKRIENPFFYAAGISYMPSSGNEDECSEESSDDRWFNERVLVKRGRRYSQAGMFRELYEFNVLNQEHAAVLIESLKLPDYIRLNGWGEQETLERGAWTWRVRPEMLGRISDKLRSLDLFI